jgi:hypothetical protein
MSVGLFFVGPLLLILAFAWAARGFPRPPLLTTVTTAGVVHHRDPHAHRGGHHELARCAELQALGEDPARRNVDSDVDSSWPLPSVR